MLVETEDEKPRRQQLLQHSFYFISLAQKLSYFQSFVSAKLSSCLASKTFKEGKRHALADRLLIFVAGPTLVIDEVRYTVHYRNAKSRRLIRVDIGLATPSR